MKDIKKNLKLIAKDKIVFIPMVIVFMLGIIFFATTMMGVIAYDRLIYVRYTIFGSEHFYKDAWFTRIFIAIIGLFIAIVHNLIVAKFYAISGRKLALFFTAMNFFLLIVGFFIASAIMREIVNI